jgi:hypothetical protein
MVQLPPTSEEVKKSAKDLIAVVVLLIIVGIVVWIWSAGGIFKTVLSLRFSVSPENISIEPKPHDCDYNRAPLGDKGCHYEPAVTAYNAAAEVVGGDHAPKYSHDTNTGKPIVSWNYGKTWDWYSGTEIPDQKIKSVVVTWSKVSEEIAMPVAPNPPTPVAPNPPTSRPNEPVPRWGMQLTTNWSESKAWATYRLIQKQYAALIGDREPIVIRSRGVGLGNAMRYNIRIADDDRAYLEELCNKLIADGGACVVLRNDR